MIYRYRPLGRTDAAQQVVPCVDQVLLGGGAPVAVARIGERGIESAGAGRTPEYDFGRVSLTNKMAL